MWLPPPPPAPTAVGQLPPLSFQGFRAGMPVGQAGELIRAAGGSLRCKPTLDARMRDCTGAVRLGELPRAEVLISSVHDSSAVIVLSFSGAAELAARWIPELSARFGTPNPRGRAGRPRSWQWIRSGTMLRVAERKSGGGWETSVTLTHGPLLDGLGAAQPKPG